MLAGIFGMYFDDLLFAESEGLIGRSRKAAHNKKGVNF